jgi:hypothetical protein
LNIQNYINTTFFNKLTILELLSQEIKYMTYGHIEPMKQRPI